MYYGCHTHRLSQGVIKFSQVPKAWTRTVAPTGEIIDRTLVKRHCRVPADVTVDDAWFTKHEAACEKFIEDRAEMAFREQEWELALEYLPTANPHTGLVELRLERPPVTAVNSVSYYNADNELVELDEQYWTLESRYSPPILNLALWNAGVTYPDRPTHKTQWIVNFDCGAEALTEQMEAALLNLIGHLYKNHEATGTLNSSVVLPLALNDIIDSLKWRL